MHRIRGAYRKHTKINVLLQSILLTLNNPLWSDADPPTSKKAIPNSTAMKGMAIMRLVL